MIRISLKTKTKLFLRRKTNRKQNIGVADQITTITSFKKLVLAIFSWNLRFACFWRSRTRPQARQGEFLWPCMIVETLCNKHKNFQGFWSNFFFYPSRGSGQTRVYYLNKAVWGKKIYFKKNDNFINFTWYCLKVSSVRTPMSIKGRLERVETNQIHFK